MNAALKPATQWVLPPAFESMREYPQWIVYQLHDRDATGKWKKRPIDHQTGRVPPKGCGGQTMWVKFDEAARVAARLGTQYGVGFYFTKDDPFFFLDIDHCAVLDVNGTHTGWSPIAIDLCTQFTGAAVEISSSTKGLHVIGQGKVPPHKCKNGMHGIELYTQKQWVALTGTNALGSAGTDHTKALHRLIADYLQPNPVNSSEGSAAWTDGAIWPIPGGTDDVALINKARSSKSARAMFGDGLTFETLWTADSDALGQQFPPQQHAQSFDASSADQSLANRLIWWTGGDCERTKKLMNESSLVRDKYERGDYLDRTILNALKRVAKNQPKGRPAPAALLVDAVSEDHHTVAAVPQALHLCTDQANACRLASRYRHRLISCAGDFYVFDGTRYKRDDGLAQRLVCELSSMIRAEADAMRVQSDVALKSVAPDEIAANLDHPRLNALRHGLTGSQAFELTKMADALDSWSKKSEMKNVQDAALSRLKGLISVDVEKLDANKWLLNCLNGTIDLRTGELREHQRQYKCSCAERH